MNLNFSTLFQQYGREGGKFLINYGDVVLMILLLPFLRTRIPVQD